MSTKRTIAYGGDFHLYRECLDDESVYLQLDSAHFEASSSSGVTVRIPMVIWETIREFRGMDDPDVVDSTDGEIEIRVRKFIRERMDSVAKATDGNRKALLGLMGMMVYGSIDEPAEEQVRRGIESLKERRAKQRALRAAIQALKDKQRRR